MPSPLKLLTLPEIIARMLNTVRAQTQADTDLTRGSIDRSIIEAAALQIAAQYIALGSLLDLFSRGNTKGDDLDRRGIEFGADVFEEMRRRKAQASLAHIVVGDGTVRKLALFATNVPAFSTSFDIDDGSLWPSSGSAVAERSTLRQEPFTFTRTGNTLTVVSPAGGLANPHIQGGALEVVATQSVLAVSTIAGTSTAQIFAGTESAWPSSGSVIFERETPRRELRAFTRSGAVLTLSSPASFTHAVGTDVILSTFGSDRPISTSAVAYVPETAVSQRVVFRPKAASLLKDGDFVSAPILAESDAVGAATRVGSDTITQWQNAPFVGATVTNPNAAARGRDKEKDDDYNARMSAFIQSLSRGTALAIETLTAGQQDPFSNLIAAFTQTVEPVGPGEAQLFLTDGTSTFAADAVIKTGRDVLIADARLNDRRARLNEYGPFAVVASPANQITPRVFRSAAANVATSVGVNFLEDSSAAWTVNQWAGFFVKTDDNQFFSIVSNTAIRLTISAAGATPSLGAYAIFNFSVSPLVPGIDYKFNPSNGDLELVTGLGVHHALVATDDNALTSVGAYTYTRGLAAFVQRLVNGDRSDIENFPGIKSLGTQCRVVVPTIVSPQIVIQVIAQNGVTDDDLRSTVQSVIQGYVNGLGIGQAILLSEIVRLVKALVGVRDCKIISPSANPTVSEGQIARITAQDIEVV